LEKLLDQKKGKKRGKSEKLEKPASRKGKGDLSAILHGLDGTDLPKIISGCYENYLNVKYTDLTLTKVM